MSIEKLTILMFGILFVALVVFFSTAIILELVRRRRKKMDNAGLRTPDVPSEGGNMNKKAVEVLQNLLAEMVACKNRTLKNSSHKVSKSFDVRFHALQKAIEALEAIQKAEGMLPEAEKFDSGDAETLGSQDREVEAYKTGRNDYRQQAIPIVAKLLQRIKELENGSI